MNRHTNLLLLGMLATACGGDALTEEQKKKLNDKALAAVNQGLDKWLTDLGVAVPQEQCGAAALCSGANGQAIECPDACKDSCNGTCDKPSRERNLLVAVEADIGGKFGTVTASFETSVILETTDHKKATHNHKTESDRPGKDPAKWVNWYMTFRGKVEVDANAKVTTQTGQTIAFHFKVSDEIKFSRCGFADCGGECGPKGEPTTKVDEPHDEVAQ